MMGVNAMMWVHMLSQERNRLRQRQREQEEGHQQQEDSKRGGEEKGGVHKVASGPSTSDVGLFFCQAHNLDFLDPLPTSEI